MRYTGQGYEVPVDLPGGELGRGLEAELRTEFDAAYRRRYGTALTTAPVEALHWRLHAEVPAAGLNIAFERAARDPRRGERQAWFAEVDGFVPISVFDRYSLAPGTRIEGPAVIEEDESTIVVGPAAVAEVDAMGNVMLRIGG